MPERVQWEGPPRGGAIRKGRERKHKHKRSLPLAAAAPASPAAPAAPAAPTALAVVAALDVAAVSHVRGCTIRKALARVYDTPASS